MASTRFRVVFLHTSVFQSVLLAGSTYTTEASVVTQRLSTRLLTSHDRERVGTDSGVATINSKVTHAAWGKHVVGRGMLSH